ncbi:hypothetical protein BKA83DRAFT_4157673, partial [Pisolithus microcarpus]
LTWSSSQKLARTCYALQHFRKHSTTSTSGEGPVVSETNRKRNALAATAIANEWENQEIFLKQHALPMTSITARAIDAFRDEATREQVQATLLNYLDTDTYLVRSFHHDDPPPLHWEPLLEWVRATYGVEVKVFDSQTKKVLGNVIAQMDPWEMAAMERATYVTKSFLIALALVKRHLTVEQAALAAQVEVESQIQRWGEVEDTHDVDFHDVRRQLGSSACLVINMV